jgi:hypothetical protein
MAMLVNKFVDIFSPSRKTYYSFSKNEYYARYTFPTNFSTFKTFFEVDATQASIVPIQFRNIEFLVDREAILKEMGEPRYKHKCMIQNHAYRIYFYKKMIAGREAIIQLHLINNQFFAACYTYRRHPVGGIKAIGQVIIEKYSTQKNYIGENIYFKDDFGNSIRAIDNVNINIFYMSGDENIKSLIYSLSEELQKKQVEYEGFALSQMRLNF